MGEYNTFLPVCKENLNDFSKISAKFALLLDTAGKLYYSCIQNADNVHFFPFLNAH